jgi:predicted lactoylglutathione lyase
MEKVIPILPCIDIEKQLNFYNSIGFETVHIYSKNYLVIKYTGPV